MVHGQGLVPFGAPDVSTLYRIRVASLSGYVRNEPAADSVPARLLPFPLQRAGRPGQLFSVKKYADRSFD